MGAWQLVAGRKRCEHCSHMVERAWCWFERPGTWTRCFCEPCVEYLLDEGER
jgi:hypothetical protein